MKVAVSRAGATGVAANTGMEDLTTPSSRRNALLCALLMALCIVVARPVVDIPFGDDFSYTRTALDFARTGHIIYNGWATAMLGWQVLWGALFIKLFGFSFTIVRFSMLPFAMASVYLFHQILVRFGIGPRDAVLGTLTLGLSPLFFMIATTYMTDVSGVFIILLCLYMCQRAVVVQGTRAAFIWLISAGIVNLLGGTVRQTSWLGVLVMVPSTAWLLRRHRGMLLAGSATTLVGLAGVLACLHWAKQQPFFVPEIYYVWRQYIYPISVLGEYGKAFLCLTLVLSPVVMGWLPSIPRLNRAALIRIGVVLCALVVIIVRHSVHGSLDKWLAPWLIPFLQLEAALIQIPPHLQIFISILVPATGLIVAEQIFASGRNPATEPLARSPYWITALWLVGPFALSYLLVLFPRAATTVIQDRYLLGIMPSAIVLLLIAYEHWVAPALPSLSIVILALFAICTIAATHDYYADLRATHAAVQELLSDGVPRTVIAEGMAPDLWEQLQVAGYVNSSNMVTASANYNPHVPPWPFPEKCINSAPSVFEPVIRPQYFVGYVLNQCFAPTKYQPIAYQAWIPPFHRTKLVVKILTTPEKAP